MVKILVKKNRLENFTCVIREKKNVKREARGGGGLGVGWRDDAGGKEGMSKSDGR